MDEVDNPFEPPVSLQRESVDVDRSSPLAVSIIVDGLTFAATWKSALAMSDSLTTGELFFVLGVGTTVAMMLAFGTCQFLYSACRKPLPDDEFFGASVPKARGYDKNASTANKDCGRLDGL